MSDDTGVVYTVKDMISMLERTIIDQINGINHKLDRIGQRLDEKASNIRVDGIEHRISLAEDRIGKIELHQAGAKALSSFHRWIIGTVGAATLIAGAELIYLAAGGH